MCLLIDHMQGTVFLSLGDKDEFNRSLGSGESQAAYTISLISRQEAKSYNKR